MLYLTERAAQRFNQIRAKEQRPGAAMRIAVLGGDCAGLKYHIGLEEFRASDDYCVRSEEIDLYIDHLSAPYLWGSEIDWLEMEDESGFVIYNPNQGRSRGGCSNDGNGQGCMTRGDGKHCVKPKSHSCSCSSDSTEAINRLDSSVS